ncbi:MAG: hypothetical protein ABIE03_07030 [Patescibacteria group bacterium]|nr:hypothetical protein [Patescibacteria group bacterium]
MHKLKPFIIKHWDKLAVFAVSLILFVFIFIPFICFNSLDKYDTPGLLSLSWFIRDYTFPDFQGWNPYFFAGFPQGILYPPLFHYVVALIGKVVSINLAYKLIVSVAGLAIPWTVYRFSKVIYKERSWSLLSTLFILVALVVLPGYMGFNFDGLLDYGLGPSFVTIPMFFLYLERLFDEKRCFIGPAVIFSVMLLTNLVAPVFALLITAVHLLLNIKSRSVSKKVVLEGVLIVLLTLFWVVPFILYKEYSVTGVPIQGGKVLSFLAAGAVSFVSGFIILHLKKSSNVKLLMSILFPGVLFAGLSVLDSLINSTGTKFSIPAVHPFRLLIFTFLGVAASMTFIVQKVHPVLLKTVTRLKMSKFFVRPKHISLVLSLSACVLIGLVLVRLEPAGVEGIQLHNHFNWDGRVMRAYKVTEVLDQSRAVVDRSILYNAGNVNEEDYYNFGVDGLLKESSYLAPFYQSLAKNLDPENFDWSMLDDYYLENQKVPEEKVQQYLNLLWIKHLFVIKQDFPYCSKSELLATFSSNSKKDGIVQRDVFLCDLEGVSNSKFVDVIETEPSSTSNWDEEISKWWTGSDESLLIDGSNGLVKQPDTDNDADISYSFSKDLQELKLKLQADETIPVLVKVSYFPKWKAYENEKEIPLYRVSPNLIALNLNREATLKYERTSFEYATLAISVIGWIFALGYVLYAKTKGIKTKV